MSFLVRQPLFFRGEWFLCPLLGTCYNRKVKTAITLVLSAILLFVTYKFMFNTCSDTGADITGEKIECNCKGLKVKKSGGLDIDSLQVYACIGVIRTER